MISQFWRRQTLPLKGVRASRVATSQPAVYIMLALFSIGPMELIVVGSIILGVVVAIAAMSKRSGGKLRGCPHCGQAVSQGETTCPKCGGSC